MGVSDAQVMPHWSRKDDGSSNARCSDSHRLDPIAEIESKPIETKIMKEHPALFLQRSLLMLRVRDQESQSF